MRIDHDRIFKELLTTFFQEFIELFFPEFQGRIDWSSLKFLSNEAYSDKPQKRQVDLLAQVRLIDQDQMFFLIHLEHQAQPQKDFEKRMFDYYCYLTISYQLPVFPIALLSYAAPRRQEPHSHTIQILGKQIVDFQYQVLQLNQMPWRQFINSTNPVAAALMAKMKIEVADRPLVKLQCLRLILSLQLDESKMRLIAGFVETYLVLSAEENLALRREIKKIQPQEANKMLKLTNFWIEEGKRKGLKLGEKRGEKRGEARGRTEAKVEVALNMHKQGFALEVIAAATGISLDDLQKTIPPSTTSPAAPQ